MTRTVAIVTFMCVLRAVPAGAQLPALPPTPPAPGSPAAAPVPPAQTPTPRQAPTPKPPAAPELPEPPEAPRADRQQRGQPINIRLDVTIIDEGGPQQSRKAVSVTLADRQSGQVRSSVHVPGMGPVPLSLDALPTLATDGRIFARVTLEYQPNPRGAGPAESPSVPAQMRLSFGVILENGKPVIAAQAADPVTDRRVSVEVKATVLK